MPGLSLALPFPHTNMPPGKKPNIIKLFAIFIILFSMSALLYGICGPNTLKEARHLIFPLYLQSDAPLSALNRPDGQYR